jgi:hypothetical protein
MLVLLFCSLPKIIQNCHKSNNIQNFLTHIVLILKSKRWEIQNLQIHEHNSPQFSAIEKDH